MIRETPRGLSEGSRQKVQKVQEKVQKPQKKVQNTARFY